MTAKDPLRPLSSAGASYPRFQMARALASADRAADPSAKERALRRAERFRAVVEGIADGSVTVGSRTPVAAPAWATLEVVTGGFATGALLAGGPLQPHENQLAAEVGVAPDTDWTRPALNAYFLSDAGLAQLQERLRSGCYDVRLPEEGALLAVAWLVAHGGENEARGILEAVEAYFDPLRFYPVPADRPQPSGSEVHVDTVGEVRRALAARPADPRLLAQREAELVWRPLYDRLVGLVLETVEGDPPLLAPGDAARQVVGGWPCRIRPDGWTARMQAWSAEFDRHRAKHALTTKPHRSKDHFPQLRTLALRFATDPAALSGKEVGRIRLILAANRAKHGLPGSSELAARREKHAAQARLPLYSEIAPVLAARLAPLPPEHGLSQPDDFAFAVTPEEAARAGLPSGCAVPAALRTRLARCLDAAVDVLVERGLVGSGDQLALLLPQLVAQSRAAGFSSPELRTLYAAVYRAFRRRRSLLLLDLQSQVKLEELPWVSALERFRTPSRNDADASRRALVETAELAIASFPQAILPNKLLQELQALVKGAGIDLPLVEELASDIFMGRFTPTFVRSAKQAAALLAGSLYARYYGIDVAEIMAMPESTAKQGIRQWFGGGSADPLATLCASRAGVPLGTWRPATNGMILEQQQILTTHNLASLFSALDLRTTLGPRLPELARKCFTWIVRRLQANARGPHDRLIAIKNSAYAWRQMIFHLSLADSGAVEAFLSWADELLQRQPAPFQERFRPALGGLAKVVEGYDLDSPHVDPLEARRFLGWSNSGHWLF